MGSYGSLAVRYSLRVVFLDVDVGTLLRVVERVAESSTAALTAVMGLFYQAWWNQLVTMLACEALVEDLVRVP